jgi:hypothetical protein
MPKPRKPDPLWAKTLEIIGADPKRQKEISSGFVSKACYLKDNYKVWHIHLDESLSFNDSLRNLKRGLQAGWSKSLLDGLHLELLVFIDYTANELACERGESCTETDREFAARKAITVLKPRRGRPPSHVFSHHVKALAALIYEKTGRLVHTTLTKDSVYDPQVTCDAGQFIIDYFKIVEPEASPTSIVNIILDMKREYPTKPIRFSDFFPLYGARITPI